MATTLSTLNFVVPPNPPTYSAKPTNETRRAKLIVAIMGQINLINGEISGTPYIAKVTKKGITSDKKSKKWYWLEAVGAVLCDIHYGSTALKLAGDRSPFKSASLPALVKSLTLIITAVNAGELDTL